MGYRSQVVLAIAPEASSAFMALCAKNPKVLELCQNADQFVSGRDDEGDWFMYWDSIKWYDGYPEVEALNQFVMMMESDNLTDYGEPELPMRDDGTPQAWSGHFKFLRIGEDLDDTEDKGWGFNDIYIARSINF